MIIIPVLRDGSRMSGGIRTVLSDICYIAVTGLIDAGIHSCVLPGLSGKSRIVIAILSYFCKKGRAVHPAGYRSGLVYY